MAADTATPSSRRAFMVAVVGGVAATVAQALGRPTATSAANGDSVVLGQENAASETTTIRNTTTTSPVFTVRSNLSSAISGIGGGDGSSGVSGTSDGENSSGVSGFSVAGTGVAGLGDHLYGVYGRSTNAIGVRGDSNSSEQPAIIGRGSGGATGVAGLSGGSESTSPTTTLPLDTGVFGFAAGGSTRPASAGVGVHGRSTVGTGVFAQAESSGTALRVQGRASFSRSGIVTVGSGKRSIVRSLNGLTAASIVFAVVRSGPGDVWVRKVTVTTGSFAVLLNKTASSTTTISWIAFG